MISVLIIVCMGVEMPVFVSGMLPYSKGLNLLSVLNETSGHDGLERNSTWSEALNMLGMLRGTGNGYETDRIPTRSEMLVMIIRLLGKEQVALEQSYPHPFKDTHWDEPYVSYGYYHGIVKGISDDCFGGNQEASLKQYCTMLLRVLGYDDSNGDFTYENAVPFAALAFGEVLTKNGEFDRGKMAELTCYTLNTRKKDSVETLGQALVKQRVFTQQQLIDAQRCWEQWEQKEAFSSTTVLIYTVGSDLESQQGRLSNDLKEILLAAPDKNCRVLLQTGGTIQYRNEWMTDRKAERFCVQGSELSKIEGNIATTACDPQSLTDFIRWGATEAPSQRYILVLWDHGYGIKGGFGADELNNRKTMPVSELRDAIADAGVFFEIIAFDACLMGTVEAAYALRNHTKYLIASEEATPACGLYYTTWLAALERNPSIQTQRLGRLILDSFILHAGIEANIPTTISMMKVDRVEALINQILLFTGNLRQAAGDAELLGKNEGIFDQFDLLGVIQGVPAITAGAQALVSEVRCSSDGEKYMGIALYIPVYKPEDWPSMRRELEKIGLNESWLNLIYQYEKYTEKM